MFPDLGSPGAPLPGGEPEEEPEGGNANVQSCENSGCDNNQGGNCSLASITISSGGECDDRTNKGEEEGEEGKEGAVPSGPALTGRAPAPPPAPGARF